MASAAKTPVLLPLTNNQALLLAGQRLQPQDPLYNMAFCFRLAGRVDATAFARGFADLVASCDTLRLALVDSANGPALQDLGCPAGEYLFEDLSQADKPEEQLQQWLEAHRARLLDPAACQYESALLKLGEQEFAWFFNQHHLFTDAWSVSLLFDRLAQLYQLQCDGAAGDSLPLRGMAETAGIPPRTEESRQIDADYWRERQKLTGRVARFYRELPRETVGRTRRYHCALGVERCRRLAELIARPGFTSLSRDLACMQVFTTVLFAYLHRISGGEILAIGTPSHSRSTAKLRATAGLLINIFPLYLELEESASFARLYQQVARANQELLMHAAPDVASAMDSRAFDVLLNYIPSTFGDFAGIPISTDWVHSGFGDSGHLLRLQVHDFNRSGQFTLLFDLNERAFSEEEAQWVQTHYLTLLDALLDNPEQAFSALPLATIDEQLDLARGENPWPRQSNVQHTVVELLQRRVREQPSVTALRCQGQQWSYAELDRRSAELAGHLADRGAGPGQVVAMLLPRSLELVAAAIAVLRSGATLLPLDPCYPVERNDYMLRDAGALLVISRSDTLAQAQLEPRATVLLEGDWPVPVDDSAPPPAPALEHGAYIIYTSGSTGQPKGVLVGHRALSNYIGWAAAQYLRGEALTFPLFTPVCFDLTVTSLFTPLTGGGSLVIYPEPGDEGEITIHRVIEDNVVDMIKLTPAHLALIGNMDLSRSRLRGLIVGGEDLKVDLACTISDYLGTGVAIYNEYGPTEATVGCTLHRFDATRDTGASVPIGRPISNAMVYVLDRHLNPVPRGVTGELYIAGIGLADGYLNQATMTAERFLPDPFHDGQKMYRSGDLARWSHRGYLEYLGRRDHQVKIRGVRIETAEIEAALLDLDQVNAAVVDAVLPQHRTAQDDDRRCHRCGIEGRHPAAQLDNAGLCRVCRIYERNREHAQAYFRSEADLRARIADIRARASGTPDCIMLLSGGKDSSYALCRLVDLGLTPLVFTLDNGYISDGAMANIRALVQRLGLELVVGSTPVMDDIFVESLTRHSNVCNGCFKTIYTLSMKLARERGIDTICTGLSRGQIFETRVAHLFQQGIYDPGQIDRQIVEARKAYHRVDDVIARSMDVSMFTADDIFEEIDFLDFYRYTEVSLDEIYDYLHTRVPWIRPSDTGRSTNCLINDAGIYVHKSERGYHNYALPYSWDVRLGHKQRDAAVHELEDEIDQEKVQGILAGLGYKPRNPAADAAPERQLIAWYAAAVELAPQVLRESLARRLPAEFIPRQFVHLSHLPLTSNGKVDRDALPRPQLSRQELAGRYAAPRNDIEHLLTQLWQRMLALDEVGIDDNFFELGGDSIVNVQIVAAAREQGVAITPQQLFDYPTVRQLAEVAEECAPAHIDQGPVTGEAPLLPALQRYFADNPAAPQAFYQAVVLQCRQPLDPALLRDALAALLVHHDALRSRFEHAPTGWRQLLMRADAVEPGLKLVDARGTTVAQRHDLVNSELGRIGAGLDLGNGKVLQATCLRGDARQGDTLLVAISQLVVDGISWRVLLEDLECAYTQLAAGEEVALPPKSISVIDWGRHLDQLRTDPDSAARAALWPAAGHGQGLPHNPAQQVGSTLDSLQRIECHLERAATARLARGVSTGAGVQVQDLLVTALLQVLLPLTGEDSLVVEMEGFGRMDPRGEREPLRTVGWFTSFYPLTFRLSDSGNDADDIKAVRQQLQLVPAGGVEYALHHGPSAPAPLMFSYLGHWDRRLTADSMFELARPVFVQRAAYDQRRQRLAVTAMIFDDRLQLEWQFSPMMHRHEDIERLAAQHCRRLESLIDFCATGGELGLTPADFPEADIDQQELDDILEQFGELP